MNGFALNDLPDWPTYADPDPRKDPPFSVGGSVGLPQSGGHTTQGGSYDYEWMNALTQAADAIGSALPVLGDLLQTTGLQPQQPQTGPTQQPPTGGGIVVEPVPWYEQLPPWALAAGAALAVVLIVKALE